MLVGRLRGKIVRTLPCCIVYGMADLARQDTAGLENVHPCDFSCPSMSRPAISIHPSYAKRWTETVPSDARSTCEQFFNLTAGSGFVLYAAYSALAFREFFSVLAWSFCSCSHASCYGFSRFSTVR